MTGPLPTPDTAASIDFLEHLLPTQRWDLASIPPDEGRPEFRTFPINARTEAARWIDARQGKTGLYYHPNQLLSTADNRKAKKSDVAAVCFLYVDVDTPTEATLRALQTFVPKPTVIVFSGGGYQG